MRELFHHTDGFGPRCVYLAMRAALLLLVAATLQAQPFIGPEVRWRTTSAAPTYRPAPQAARMAPDGDGFVVAWSEVEDGASRAYAGRMDGAGHLTGVGVRTIGTADAAVIVPFGNRYIAAWEEPEPGDARPTVISATLDRNFNLLSAHSIGLTSTPPFIRTSV